MNLNFNKMLFMYMMSLGILLSLSSNNWLMIWVGLEISLMSIMPLMSNKNQVSSESCLKYFIVQSISSSLMMLGMLLMISDFSLNYTTIISLSIMIKVGAAPFHIWMLQIIESMNWMMTFLILTMIKIAPMTLLSYISLKLNLISILCLIIGSIMGLSQSSIKKILVYSSIFNLGFMMTSIQVNSIWMTYFIIYSASLILVIIPFMKMNYLYMNQMILNEKNLISKINIFMIMISMGGMPPMLSFIGKLMIMEMMMLNKEIMLMFLMITSSTITMFFYMRMSFLSSLFSSMMIKTQTISLNKISLWMLMINMMLVPVSLTLKCFI